MDRFDLYSKVTKGQLLSYDDIEALQILPTAQHSPSTKSEFAGRLIPVGPSWDQAQQKVPFPNVYCDRMQHMLITFGQSHNAEHLLMTGKV